MIFKFAVDVSDSGLWFRLEKLVSRRNAAPLFGFPAGSLRMERAQVKEDGGIIVAFVELELEPFPPVHPRGDFSWMGPAVQVPDDHLGRRHRQEPPATFTLPANAAVDLSPGEVVWQAMPEPPSLDVTHFQFISQEIVPLPWWECEFVRQLAELPPDCAAHARQKTRARHARYAEDAERQGREDGPEPDHVAEGPQS